MDNKVLWNGDIIAESEFRIQSTTDWLRFAPGFFESIKASRGKILQWQSHYERMTRGASYWNVTLPKSEDLFLQLEQFVQSHPANSGKVRIQFGVDVSNSCLDYLAILEEGESGFPLNDEGLKVGVYKDQFNLPSLDSNHKGNRRDIYLFAQQWYISRKLDDALVINQEGKVADSTRCNIFWLENGIWYTPPLHSGCVPGVMRKLIISHKDDWDLKIIEQDVLPQRLLKAEEIFLTNAIQGIIWVEILDEHEMSNSNIISLSRKLQQWEQALT